ncbi:MAG: hypothetical protein R3Y09_02245 [Clostridia bacterium]
MILYKMIHQGINDFMRELRKYKYFESSFGCFYNNYKVKSHYKDDFAEVFIFKYNDSYMNDRDFERTFNVLFLTQVDEYKSLTFAYRVDEKEVYVIFENVEFGYINLAQKHKLPRMKQEKVYKKLKFWTVEQDDK